MKMEHAYSTLEIKAMSEEGAKRTFTGIASTPSTDRMDDIVMPEGAKFKLPVPMLWQHDSTQPIGWVTAARVSDTAIEVDCEVYDEPQPGALKNRLDEAWQSLKAKLVRGLSIGFNPIETSRIEGTWGLKYLVWDFLELSAVTIPANADCSITAIKSADEPFLRASLGGRPVVRLDKGKKPTNPPGASGKSTTEPPKGKDMNIAEQLAAFETKRRAALERRAAIMSDAAEKGATLDEAQSEEYDTLGNEVKSIEEHLVRLKAHEKDQLARATPVAADAGRGDGGVEIRGSGPISVTPRVGKGIPFTRYAIALCRASGNVMHAEQIAKQWRDSTPEVELVLRAAVAAGTTTDSTWAGPLVYAQNMVSEFIEFLRPMTILGRMPKVRKVPFNIRIPRQTAGTSGTFVGEGLPAPVAKAAFDAITLTWAKAVTIVVLDNELVRNSNPSAEALVRDDIAKGISAYVDKRFIDPTYAGVANVSPASVSNGVTSRQASGATLGSVDQDVGYVLSQFASNELHTPAAIWIMSPAQAITLSLMRTVQGQPAFPNIGMDGGVWYGLPVITSNNVVSSGSPGESQIFLVDQDSILLSDDGQMNIEMSNEATLQMDSAPSAGAQTGVSMFQTGQIALKCERWINWAKRRSAAVQYIEAAQRYSS